MDFHNLPPVKKRVTRSVDVKACDGGGDVIVEHDGNTAWLHGCGDVSDLGGDPKMLRLIGLAMVAIADELID